MVDTPDATIIVAVVSLFGTLIGTFAGIMTSTKLSNYRIEQLEKKVDKHNSLIERTAILERDGATIWRNIDELKDQVRAIEHDRTEG